MNKKTAKKKSSKQITPLDLSNKIFDEWEKFAKHISDMIDKNGYVYLGDDMEAKEFLNIDRYWRGSESIEDYASINNANIDKLCARDVYDLIFADDPEYFFIKKSDLEEMKKKFPEIVEKNKREERKDTIERLKKQLKELEAEDVND